jgi:hypothetical protein
MANIREYTNPINGLQPQEGGASVMARAATRAGVLGAQAADARLRSAQMFEQSMNKVGGAVKSVGTAVENYQTQKEVGQFGSDLIKTQQQLDDDWSKSRARADPNQPLSEDWLHQTAEPALDKLLDNVSTPRARAHAEAMILSAKEHYLHTTVADDSAAAGLGAQQNLQTVVDGATLRSNNDFSTVQYNADLIKQSVEATINSGHLTPQAALKVRAWGDKAVKENMVAGLEGAARRNPGAFTSDLTAGKFDNMGIDAQMKDQLLHYAKAQARAQKADALNAQLEGQIAKTKTGEAELQRITNGVVQDDGTLKMPSMKDILNNNKLTFEQRESAVRFFGSLSREPATVDDVNVYQGLRSKIGDPTNPTTLDDISTAAEQKKLTPKTAIALTNKVQAQTQVVEKDWNNAEKSATTAVKQSLKLNDTTAYDPGTPYQFQAASQYIDDMFKTRRAEGVKTHDLLDPSSKFYFLKDPGLQNILKDVKPFQPKNIKPGESAKPPVAGTAPTPKAGTTDRQKKLNEILFGSH